MKSSLFVLMGSLFSCSLTERIPESPYDQWGPIIATLQAKLNMVAIECTPALLDTHDSDRRACFDLREGDSNDSREKYRIVQKVARAVNEALPSNFVMDRGWMEDYGQYSATWDVKGKPEWGLLVLHEGHHSAKRGNYHPRMWKDGATPPDLQGDVLLVGLYFDEWYEERQEFLRRNP